MKTIGIALGLLLLTGAMLLSCRKTDLREQQKDQEITMENLQVTPAFNWETTREVSVVLTSNSSGVVRIQPSSGIDYYNKGYLQRGTSYETIIKIPTYADSVKLSLNGVSHSLKITGNALTYHFE